MTPRITQDWLTDPASQLACAVLERGGFQAYFVGGCVRNSLLGEPVADIDISTNAHPQQVIALGEAAGLSVVPTGADHGTVTVVIKGQPFEVTTFRRDIETDGRHAIVRFADTMIEDAARRDFTMNALYADRDGIVIDPLGGLPDLMARRLRFIGDPDARIREDYLRILRFFRFHAWYANPNGGIDRDGLAACADNLSGLATLSRERIGHEMLKLLAAPDPAPAVAAFASTGGLAMVVPGASTGALAVLVAIEQALGVPPAALRRLAVMTASDLTKALRLAKKQSRHLDLVSDQTVSAAELAFRHGATVAIDALLVRSALAGRFPDKAEIDEIEAAARQTFPLRAADLQPALSGPLLGAELARLEALWINSGFTLDREALLNADRQG